MAGRQPPTLRARALQWLALREHSRHELRAKLLHRARQRAENPNAQERECQDESAMVAEVDALLESLQAQGLLSEERFVESRVHARSARFGNRRIAAELARHRLGVDAQAASQLQASEPQRAMDVWNRRFGQAPLDAKERQRQTRFLMGRGFSSEAIRHVMAKVSAQIDSGDEDSSEFD